VRFAPLVPLAVTFGVAVASDLRAELPLPKEHAAFDAASQDDGATSKAHAASAAPPALHERRIRNGCSDDMVRVANRFCIDRYEAMMVDADSGRTISPYYPPSPKLFLWVVERWTDAVAAAHDEIADEFPFPPVPAWQRSGGYEPMAVSRPGVVPQGYVSRNVAGAACAMAGKRLCTLDEWKTACGGEHATKFPYGPTYREGACNVFRDGHPARILHGNASEGLLDPRLNQVALDGDPLLRTTGATPACRSTWGEDAVYDMVGNLDEWVDDPTGTFVGGFYARATRNGCDAKVSSHAASYFDYSIGVRCCDRLR
jgi:sulfatase modifying factor 1